MSVRLIDPSKAFRPVYSIYRHEYLGCLISSHVVQELENGKLSLRYQGLYPDNFNHFGTKLDDRDDELVKLLAKVYPSEIIKKFGPKAKNEMDFYLNVFQNEVKKSVGRYINRHLSQAIQLMHDREVFVMGKDGYPAQSPVEFLREKADIEFHFLRDKERTRYFPRVYLRGRKVNLTHESNEIVVAEPAWMLHRGQIFTFAEPVEGNKIKAFLKKDFISITRSTEKTYFTKFVPQIIERYRVVPDGIEIKNLDAFPRFRFLVNTTDSSSLSLDLKVTYGGHSFALDPKREYSVAVQRDGDEVTFIKIKRNGSVEKNIANLMERLSPGDDLMGWEFMSRPEGLRWLSRCIPMLRAQGIEIVQEGDNKLNFEVPKIEIDSRENGDWFDIRAVVVVAGFSIPFIKFRSNILKGKRDYVLPDGSTVILPESWFTDFRHLVEIAEEREGDVLAVKKYQAAVLELKAPGTGLKGKLKALAEDGKIPSADLPKGLKAELRSYQKKGFDWLDLLRKHNLGGILADDMGLGKTLQTLTLLLKEREKGVKQPSMVVMPTSLIHNWVAESKKFTPDLHLLIHTGSNRTKNTANFALYDVIFTTYGLVRQDLKLMKDFPFHYVILDESQMIKNASSKTSKAVKELKAAHRLSLTGTPLENTLMDLWSQMGFLNPGLLGTEKFFKTFYTVPIEKEADEKRQAQLRTLLHPFILRRTKEQVASELPPKVEQQHFCEMSKDQKKIYDETKNAYRNYLMDLKAQEFKKNKLNILQGLQKLRQIAIHPGLVEEGEGIGLEKSGKFLEFKRLLEEVLAKGSKVLVFSQFVRLLKLLEENLKEEKIIYSYLDGSTKNRQAVVNQFQNNNKNKVFLISLKAGGVGLNLTAADYVFILDPWWNPAVENQAVDRSYRIGQTKTVFSYKFITKGTIEEKIVKLQERKAKLSDDIIGVEDEIFKTLNVEDMVALLD